MPFTLAHPLAIVPIAFLLPRGWPVSALIIGSMIPDFPLFFSLGLHYSTTHAPLGVLTACVPLGWLVYLLYHELVKQPMLLLLPTGLTQRLFRLAREAQNYDLRSVFKVTVAIGIGAYSHIIWDAFTHANRWGVELLPWLQQSYRVGDDVVVYGYQIFQHSSTFIGLVLLALLAGWWLGRQSVVPLVQQPAIAWRFLLLGAMLGGALWAGLQASWPAWQAGFSARALFELVTTSGRYVLLGLLSLSLIARALPRWFAVVPTDSC